MCFLRDFIKNNQRYIISQVLGGIAGAGILYIILTGKPSFEIGSFAANGYGALSPGGYGLLSHNSCITSMVESRLMSMLIDIYYSNSGYFGGFPYNRSPVYHVS